MLLLNSQADDEAKLCMSIQNNKSNGGNCHCPWHKLHCIPTHMRVFNCISRREELQEICPISVSPRGKQGHTCDTLVWHVHLSITCRIMCENRRVWNGLWRWQFRKKMVFFSFWGNGNIFQLNPLLAEFSTLFLSPLKNPFPLTSPCILQQDIHSQCIYL